MPERMIPPSSTNAPPAVNTQIPGVSLQPLSHSCSATYQGQRFSSTCHGMSAFLHSCTCIAVLSSDPRAQSFWQLLRVHIITRVSKEAAQLQQILLFRNRSSLQSHMHGVLPRLAESPAEMQLRELLFRVLCSQYCTGTNLAIRLTYCHSLKKMTFLLTTSKSSF